VLGQKPAEPEAAPEPKATPAPDPERAKPPKPKAEKAKPPKPKADEAKPPKPKADKANAPKPKDGKAKPSKADKAKSAKPKAASKPKAAAGKSKGDAEPGNRSHDKGPHQALNNPVGEPDETEYPDPYETRPDPRAPIGEDAHPATGSESTSEPPLENDPEHPEGGRPPRRENLDQ
jgi:hypothetical protein